MWFQKFRFGEEKRKESRVAMPILILSKADFDYSVGPNSFRNFSYIFDVNLRGTSENRIQQSRAGVEKLVESLDRVYPSDKGFKRGQKGNLSSDSRKIEISYYASTDFFSNNIANINFNANFTDGIISSSYAMLFLYGADKDDLLATHDILVGLPGVDKSPSAIKSLSQIEQIRNGNGPKVQNFLLG